MPDLKNLPLRAHIRTGMSEVGLPLGTGGGGCLARPPLERADIPPNNSIQGVVASPGAAVEHLHFVEVAALDHVSLNKAGVALFVQHLPHGHRFRRKAAIG